MGKKNTSLNTGNLTNENKKKICEKKLENPDIRQSDLAEWAKRELHLAVAPTQGTISNILKRKEEYLSTKPFCLAILTETSALKAKS